MCEKDMREIQKEIKKDTDKRVETVKMISASARPLTVMICDDEKAHILHLQQLLEQLQEEISLRITTDSSPERLLQQLRERVECRKALPDIIFLDIRMPQVDGIAFGKALHNIAPDIYVVFTTAYQEYAIEGYEAQAFRYLLKPLTKEMIRKVLKDAQNDMSRKKKLLLKLAKGERMFSLQDILYLSAEDKYTVLYTADGYYVDRTSLADYETLLCPYGFYRIHRKYIVNLYHHKGLEKGFVLLSEGTRLPISRRRADAYYAELFQSMEKELVQ